MARLQQATNSCDSRRLTHLWYFIFGKQFITSYPLPAMGCKLHRCLHGTQPSMRYEKFAPDKTLAPFVECYFVEFTGR
jgi:hypothetical protein